MLLCTREEDADGGVSCIFFLFAFFFFFCTFDVSSHLFVELDTRLRRICNNCVRFAVLDGVQEDLISML